MSRPEKVKKKQRVDYHFHQFVKRITESRQFDVAIMFVIFMNTLSMTFDTSYHYREQLKYVIFIADEMFLGKFRSYAAVAMPSFQGDQCLTFFASGETIIVWYQSIASTDTSIFAVSYTRNKFDMMQTP